MTETAEYPRSMPCENRACRREAGITLKVQNGNPVYACQHCTTVFTVEGMEPAVTPRNKSCTGCGQKNVTYERDADSLRDHYKEFNYDTGDPDAKVLWRSVPCGCQYYYWRDTGEFC